MRSKADEIKRLRWERDEATRREGEARALLRRARTVIGSYKISGMFPDPILRELDAFLKPPDGM